MSQQPIIGPTGTQIYSDGQHTILRFRDRELLRITYLDIRLDTSGDRDLVLQNRLNQGSRLLGLDYHIIRREGEWVVRTYYDHYSFRDGMHLRRSVGKDHEYVRYENDPPR
jgi:hypothetical protein